APDIQRGVASHLLGRRGDARHTFDRGEVADDIDVRIARHREVRLYFHAACPVEGHAERAPERRARHAGGPDDRARGYAVGAERDAFRVHGGDALAEPYRDADALELPAGLLRQVGRIGRQHAVGALDEHHARIARIEP